MKSCCGSRSDLGSACQYFSERWPVTKLGQASKNPLWIPGTNEDSPRGPATPVTAAAILRSKRT